MHIGRIGALLAVAVAALVRSPDLSAVTITAGDYALTTVFGEGSTVSTSQFNSGAGWSINDGSVVVAGVSPGAAFGAALGGIWADRGYGPVMLIAPLAMPLDTVPPWPRTALSINNANRVSFATLGGADASGNYGGQLWARDLTSVSPISSVLAPTPPALPGVANPFIGEYLTLDVNSAGVGASFLYRPLGPTTYNFLQRINGDGTVTELVTAGYGQAMATLSKPRILENGDIYAAAYEVATGRNVILKYASGSTTAQVVYGTPALPGGGYDQIRSFGVNNAGDLAIGLEGAPDQGAGAQAAQVLFKPAGGNAVQVTSAAYGVTYIGLGISDAGKLAIVRDGAGGAELLYGTAGAAANLQRLIGAGDSFAGGTVQNFYGGSGADQLIVEMNASGQVLVNLQLSTGKSLVRVDPPGTSPQNPQLPSPNGECPGAKVGDFCMTIAPGSWRPLWYFDPAYAIGYRYSSLSNPFTGVLIPFAYGDGIFDLFLCDAMGNCSDSNFDVLTGEFFDFVSHFGGPLTRFALYGIEKSAQVDPADPRGFVTGLAFASDTETARFIMTPLTDTDGGTAPEPGTLALLVLGLAGLAASRRRSQ